jgi:hypothetical protein
MGGVTIDENMLIDRTIHDAINSKFAVMKVCDAPGITCTLSIYFVSSDKRNAALFHMCAMFW